MQTNFDLSPQKQTELFHFLADELENYYNRTESLRVTPDLDISRIRDLIRSFDFQNPVDGREAISAVLSGMKEHSVHTPHPMYYGLYNPRANAAGIMADLITAVLNPQLAAWSHSPYANEVEKYLIETFGIQSGYERESIDGVFATGGAEANFTAILCALNHSFPEVGDLGLQGIARQPVIYCSAETHHSIVKGARMAGLGSDSVRVISVNEKLQVRTKHLKSEIERDRLSGLEPILVVATAGTTGTGTIDNLEEVGKICSNLGVWYHVDAAYGGACLMKPEFSFWLKGIELSNSLIMDLHKWFSVPMAASMFITRDRTILHRTFRTVTDYMPRDADGMQITDPFANSFQWSRRFSGLKIYLSLLLFGRSGYAEIIDNHVKTANFLRKLLHQNDWIILNDTPLPVVCFTAPQFQDDPGFAKELCDRVVKSGEAWISVYPVGTVSCIRACITNYNTGEGHIRKLVKLLDNFRDDYRSY